MFHPASSFPLTSAREHPSVISLYMILSNVPLYRYILLSFLWKDPRKSKTTGLPVELRMPNVHWASFRRIEVFNPETNGEVGAATSFSYVLVEEQGVNFALQVIGRENATLKEKQMQSLRTVIVEKKMSWPCCQPVSASR